MIGLGFTTRSVNPGGDPDSSPLAVLCEPSLFLNVQRQSTSFGRPAGYPDSTVSVTTADVLECAGSGSHWKAAMPLLSVRHVRTAWSFGFVGLPQRARC